MAEYMIDDDALRSLARDLQNHGLGYDVLYHCPSDHRCADIAVREHSVAGEDFVLQWQQVA